MCAPLPQAFVHVRVWCNAMLEGELAHSCSHGPPPHEILVCVTRKDNDPAVYGRLATAAGPNPNSGCAPTFYQWLKRAAQRGRQDEAGTLARALAAGGKRPKTNTFEAWKRWRGVTKGTAAHETLRAVWLEYEKHVGGA